MSAVPLVPLWRCLRAPFLNGALLLAVGAAWAPTIAEPQQSISRQFVPTAVFGADDRSTLPPSLSHLRDKIGFLHLGDASVCTAFCVAGDAIATASHCLQGTTQSPPPDLQRITFSLGGTPRASTRLAGRNRSSMRTQLSSGTDALRVTPPIAAADDWTIARLDKPVCRAGGLQLSRLTRSEIERRAANGHIYQVAMHRDFEPGSLVYGAPCSIARAFAQAAETTIAADFANPAAVLMHTCDTGPGSSGSPLLTDGEQGPEVIGINVGTYVLSRPPASTNSAATANQAPGSEAIANTAIHVSQFRAAIEAFSVETSSIPKTQRRDR